MLDQITKEILDKVIIQLNKPNNKDKLEKEIIGPIFCNISNKLYPYIQLVFIMYIIHLVLIILILILIIHNKSK